MAAVFTFKDLQDEVLANLDEAGNTAQMLTLVKQFMNQAQLKRLASREWSFMYWESAETITLVANQRVYPLHEEFYKPHYFFNQGTKLYLEEVPERSLASSGARWNTDTSRGSLFRFAGLGQVRVQPTSASTISIVSSSASDSGSTKAITVKGETSTGLISSESISPNGTSTATSSTSFRKILSVTKAAAWIGTMTMTSNSGAVTNLVLGPSEFGRRFPQIELLSLPTTTDTIEYRFWRQPTKMVSDNDIPDIPPPFSQILVWDTLLTMGGYLTDISDKSLSIWRMFQDDAEKSMLAAYQEGQTLESQGRYVRHLGDIDDDLPRVYLT